MSIQDTSHGTRSQSTEDVSLMMQGAKQFCIDSICASLETDATQNGKTVSGEIAPSLIAWLQTLRPNEVIQIYDKICEELPSRNGLVVPTNEVLSNATSCSTNALLLGNSQQSSAALFYVIPYVCKDKVPLEACLVALESAKKHVSAHKSKLMILGQTNVLCNIFSPGF